MEVAVSPATGFKAVSGPLHLSPSCWSIVPHPALFSDLPFGAALYPTASLGPHDFCDCFPTHACGWDPTPRAWFLSLPAGLYRSTSECLLQLSQPKALTPTEYTDNPVYLSPVPLLSWGCPQLKVAVTSFLSSTATVSSKPSPSPWDACWKTFSFPT